MQKKFRIYLEITVGDLSDERRQEEAEGMEMDVSELESLDDVEAPLIASMFMQQFENEDNLECMNDAMFAGSESFVQVDKIECVGPLEAIEWIPT